MKQLGDSLSALWTCVLLSAATPLAAQVPDGAQWIWGAPTAAGEPADHASFVAEFTLEGAPAEAQLGLSADNHADVQLNGALVAHCDDWAAPVLVDVTSHLLAGLNTLTIEARNDGDVAGLLCFVVADGVAVFRTDATTRAADQPAHVIGPYGVAPWGKLDFSGPHAETPADRHLVPAEGLLCEEAASGFGSLIAFTMSPRGEPVVSVESGGLLTLHDDDGDGRYERSSVFCDELRACQGLCFVGDEAWATGIGPDGLGFYSLPADAAPRRAHLVASITGSAGEHGPHAVLPGPDGRLWLTLGNHVRLDAPAAESSPYKLVYEGAVIPRLLDPNGHANEVTAPGGTIFSFDMQTGRFELFSAGYRNAYDLAFAPNGDLFTFDSDMEWDIGLPWYRPVRVVHVLPGGDYGWRTGSAKWPSWYPDSLPPVLETGRGSPTGVLWCDSPALPARWHDTLLLADWSQGEVLAVHLTPDGCSYRGRAEVLLSGRPLPVTDLAFEPGGALLVSVGGRGTQGALLRVRADTAHGSTAHADAAQGDAAHAVTARADAARSSAEVEPMPFVAAAPAPRFTSATPTDQISGALGSPDRVVRYLAARALEQRSPWDISAHTGNADPAVRAEACVVLARKAIRVADSAGAADSTGAAHTVAMQAAFACRDAALELLAQRSDGRLVAARALELSLLAGIPDTLSGEGLLSMPELGAKLLPLFPSGTPALDRELAALLARTQPPGARQALLDALDEQDAPDEAAHLLLCLAALRTEADAAQTRAALDRLGALRSRPGGASYQGYLDAMERGLLDAAPADARESLRAEAHAADAAPTLAATIAIAHGAPKRDLDRTLAYVRNALDAPERLPAEGAWVFAQSCAACHVRGGFGRAGGPDLTSVGSRLGLPDLLAAIMDPSRDISDQYHSLQLFLRDGRDVQGLLQRDDGDSVQLLTSTGESLTVRAADIDTRRLSSASAMPDGLLDGRSLREIADLAAWLLEPDPVAPPARSAWEPLFAAGLDGWTGDTADWSFDGRVLLGSRHADAAAGTIADATAATVPSAVPSAVPSPVPSAVAGAGAGVPARGVDLRSPFALGDFTLACEVLLPDGSGGVAVRCAAPPASHDAASPSAGAPEAAVGYLAELGLDAWGSLVDEQHGAVIDSDAALWRPELARSGWNQLLIEARGGHVRVALNGLPAAAFIDAAPAPGVLSFRRSDDGEAPLAIRCAELRRD